MTKLTSDEIAWLEDKMSVFETEFAKPSQKMAKTIRKADTSQEGLKEVLSQFNDYVSAYYSA